MLWFSGNRQIGNLQARSGLVRLKKAVPTAVVVVLLLLAAHPAQAFDLPKYDPWYYQSSVQGYTFAIPDKAQHFYGSAMVNEFSKRLPLPGIDILGPILSLTAGFMWETYQDQKGIGFSERDLAADAMGVAASQLSSEHLSLWLDYSTTERVIMFRVAVRLDD
jgi:hypothetical protein